MHQNKGLFLVFCTALISGFSIFTSSLGVKVSNPYIFTGLKNIVTVGLLAVFILLLREHKQIKLLKKRDWLTLVLIGFVGGSVPFLLFFKGLSLTSAAAGSVIHKNMFLLVAILAFVFLKEKIDKKLMLGMGLLVAGNLFLLNITNLISLGRGELLILGATALWAVENVISKKAVAGISPRIVALGRMFFGFLFILMFWAATGELSSLASLNLSQISWVWLTALLLFAYVTTWYTGLRYIEVSKAACVLALGAPITGILDLLNGKILTGGQLAGIGLMALGILIIFNFGKKRLKKESAPNKFGASSQQVG